MSKGGRFGRTEVPRTGGVLWTHAELVLIRREIMGKHRLDDGSIGRLCQVLTRHTPKAVKTRISIERGNLRRASQSQHRRSFAQRMAGIYGETR